jgi:hypothetical protein
MMMKVRQGMTLQQSPKHPGLVRRLLQGHQILNLTEDYQHFNFLIPSIDKLRKLLERRSLTAIQNSISPFVIILMH